MVFEGKTGEISPNEIEKVRSVLQREEGVVFVPKRQLDVFVPDTNIVCKILGERNTESAMKYLLWISNYLTDAIPIADKFVAGSQFKERRKWLTNMTQKFGPSFRKAYPANNQFRVNAMIKPLSSIQFLQMLAKSNQNNEIGLNLQRISEQLDLRVKGKNEEGQKVSKSYNEMETLEEKLEVVHFLEDKFIEVLRMFSSQKI